MEYTTRNASSKGLLTTRKLREVLTKALKDAKEKGTKGANGWVFTPEISEPITKYGRLCFAVVLGDEEGNRYANKRYRLIAVSKSKKMEMFDLIAGKKIPDTCICLPDIFLSEAFPSGTWGRFSRDGKCRIFFREELLYLEEYKEYEKYFEAMLLYENNKRVLY